MSDYVLTIRVVGEEAGVAQLVDQIDAVGGQAEKSGGMLRNAFGFMAGAGVAAFAGIAAGAVGAATAGLSLNNAMEMTSAKINAFTKDGAATANILEMIQDRASKTPFEFQAMADAAAALLPVSKASGIGLEDLISKAEILAASNPAEGLEGAAFALKEAVSGDFTSVIERFNLPRQYLNQLKEQGVPAAEAVSMAMQQLGLDSDLVSNLAETASGRWSTFKDTIQGLAATATKPIFDMFSAGLGQVNGLLETVAPAATAVAASIGQGLASAIQTAGAFFVGLWNAAQPTISVLMEAGNALATFFMSAGSGMDVLGLALSLMNTFGGTVGGLLTQLAVVVQNAIQIWTDFGTTIYNVAAALMNGDLAGAWAAFTAGFAQLILDFQTYAASLGTLLMGLATTIGQAVLTWGAALVDWIAPYIPIALAALGAFVSSVWTWIQEQAPGWLVTLGSWGMALVDWATPYLSLALTTLGAWVGGLWAWVQAQAPGWGAQLTAWGAQLAAWIGPAIPAALGALAGFGSSALAWVGAQAGPLLASFSAWAQSLVVWIPGATVSFLAAWPGLLSSFLDWIAGAVGPLLAKLASWALAFTAWIVPMIPSFLVGLGGVALALATWIVSTAAVIATKVVMWAGAILGWIGANVLPALPGMLKGVLESILGWVQSAASSLGSEAASIGRNIVQGIISGVGAAAGALTNKLREMASGALEAAKRALGIASPSQVFAQQVGVQIPAGMAVGITAGMPMVNKNLVDGIAGLSESAVKAITAGSQAIAAASAYHGPGGAGLSGFLAAFADLATRFNDTAVALGGRVLGTATRFADTVGKVIAPIATAVAAFASLADLVVPARATVGQFGDALALVVGNINVVASWFQQKSVDVGAKFADGAGKMLSIVGPALEAFKKLPDLVVPSRTAVGQFGGALALVVGNIAHVATWFNAQAVTAGAAFAESAGKILALIGSGVDALSKLTTFVGIPQIAVTRFGQALQQSLVVLVAIARTWAQQAVTQAATFAEGAGKIIGIIGGGVEGFLKLRDFQGVPQTAIDAFGQALNAALGVIEYVSANWIAQFVERAATFAEGAGKAISIIGGAVDGFVKLATFQGVPQGAIDAFGQALNAALVVIEYISATWIQAFVDRAATFAEGAGKAVGIIGSAVDGFLKLVTFQGVPEAAFAAFGQALTRALTVIDAMSADWASIGLDRAVAWAGAVDAIVKTITAAVDAIGKLGQLQNGAAGLLDTFSVTLNGILTEMQRQILPATTISGENMVIGLINGILSQRSALVTAMVNTVMAAVIAARQTLGIASPSKVFEQIGQYAGAGLQGGMAAMQPAVAATSAGLGISAVNATTSALRPSGGGTTNNNQRNITVNVTVGKDAGSNPYATADAVVTEINRRLGMQGT